MKKDLSGGIANLLSGADQSVREQKVKAVTDTIVGRPTEEQEQPESGEPMAVEPTTLEDETDLINTIEDEELKKELQERLRRKRMVGRGRPRKNDQLGRRTDGYDRTSLIIPVEKWAKVKEIAFIETLTLKEIVELALDMVIDRYEQKHGEVKPQRQRPKKDISEIF